MILCIYPYVGWYRFKENERINVVRCIFASVYFLCHPVLDQCLFHPEFALFRGFCYPNATRTSMLSTNDSFLGPQMGTLLRYLIIKIATLPIPSRGTYLKIKSIFKQILLLVCVCKIFDLVIVAQNVQQKRNAKD